MATSGSEGRALERVVRLGVGLVVWFLAWPAEEDLRQDLAAARQPRLLVVGGGTPPDLLDPLEDWMWDSASPTERVARAQSLAARLPSASLAEPVLDEDGLLRMGDEWVAIPLGQVPVMALLIAGFGRIVHTEALVDALRGSGMSAEPATVRATLSRLSSRIRPLGLELVTVRQRGVMVRRCSASCLA